MQICNDKYASFAALHVAEPKAAWRTVVQSRGTHIAVIALHGGGIERGTSEVARAIAGTDLSLYLFEGLKAEDNDELHITSDRFDEPLGVALVESSEFVVAAHGAKGDMSVIYLGGRGSSLGNPMRACLERAGFDVQDHPDLKGRCRRTFVIVVNPVRGCRWAFARRSSRT